MKKHFLFTLLILCALTMHAQHLPDFFAFDEEFRFLVPENTETPTFSTISRDTLKRTISVYFSGSTDIDTLIVPDTIRQDNELYKITRYANLSYFWEIHNAYYNVLQLPHTIQDIRISYLSDNPKLKHIEVAEDNPYYTTIDGVLYDKKVERLIMCPPAKEGRITIPKTVKKVDDFAFFYCDSLTYIDVEEGNRVYQSDHGLLMKGNTLVARPAEWYNPEMLRCENGECTISENVTSIANGAIPLNAIQWFWVDKNNKKYSTLNGVLYSKDGKKLVLYPGGREIGDFLIPEGVTEISPYAFYENEHLKEVTIPASTIKIGKEAFYSTDNLTIVKIYSSKLRKNCLKEFSRGCGDDKNFFVPNSVFENFSKDKSGDVHPLTKRGERGDFYVSIPEKTLWYSDGYGYDERVYDRTIERVCITSDCTYDIKFLIKRFVNVREFVVTNSNLRCIADEGVLYRGKRYSGEPQVPTELIAIPAQKRGDYTIPTTVQGIRLNAFSNCNMVSLTFPASLDWIEAVINEGYFTHFNVAPGNPEWYAKDGVLFWEGEIHEIYGNPYHRNMLIAYPRGKQDSCYVVPKGVQLICYGAFAENQFIQEIHLTDSVRYIDYGAFYHANNLKTVYCYSVVPPYIDSYHNSDIYKEYADYPFIDTKIYVPEEAVEAYKTNEYWVEYADQIFPMPKKENDM